jgi:hypothetical protein
MIYIRNLLKKYLRSKGFKISQYGNIDLHPTILLNYDIYKYFWEITKDIPGEVADIGFGYGHSASIFSFLAEEQNGLISNKNIYYFDSFKGFPEPIKFDRSPRNPFYGDFNHRSLKEAKKQIEEFTGKNISDKFFIEGFVENTVPSFPKIHFSLINLDTDMYDSHRIVLENFYPLLNSGGVLIFDDYKTANWPGATLAIDNFFGDDIKLIKSYKGKHYIVKV